MSSPDEQLASLFSVKQVILPISSLSAMYLAYGFYIVLFGTCVYLMRSRQKAENLNPNQYLSSITLLFALATIFVVSYTIASVRDTIYWFEALRTGNYKPLISYLTQNTAKTVVYTIKHLVSILLNIVADIILIHRCFLIWSRSKRVAVPLIILSAVINALGLICTILMIVGISDTHKRSNHALYSAGNTSSVAYTISSVITNFAITLLTAGRIWWIHRQLQVRARGVYASDTIVQSISRIILESGIIYPVTSIANLILANASPTSELPPFDFWPLVSLSAGIAPTLIMVRAGFGKNIENLQDMVSDIHFASRQGSKPVYSIRHLGMSVDELDGGSDRQSSIQKNEAFV
ncbi:hypothetical protein Moror_13484 [Moniliophthora roreri MCA 2997]|uniref:Uncharacterized protein n=1 Tax=Moniliophthora roreri (strain MCA 2997) TaxID=1381753 RepID=V2WAN7_MONRO|nr:hypothetical protein Moror_13484 [Moniliophthora roreri MCA 2997]